VSQSFRLVDPDGGTQFLQGNMDFDLDGRGVPVMVEGVDVSAQAFAKGLLTATGANPMAPGYGTRARDLIGAKMLGNVTSGMLALMAENNLRYLASQQAAYANKLDLPPSEQIVGLRDISVTFQVNGYIMVEAAVMTRSGEALVSITSPGGQNV
jgi:hypothetical protein